MRRDIGPHTPPFTLSPANLTRLAEVEASCRKWGADPAASIELELEVISRNFYYAHRPLPNIFRSLDGIGFAEDWTANRDAHMAVARDAWAAANAPVWSVAA